MRTKQPRRSTHQISQSRHGGHDQYNKHINRTKPLIYAGYGSIVGIVVIGALLIFPSSYLKVDATDGEESASLEENAMGVNDAADEEDGGTGSARAIARASASISVALGSSSISTGNATTTSTGQFTYGSTSVKVTTTNSTGYKIYLAPSNGKNTLTNSSDSSVSTAIASLTTSTAGTNMSGNTWGYTIGTGAVSRSSTFMKIPTSSTSVKSTSAASASAGDTYQLGFGAHILNTLPAGNYTNTIVVSAVANYVPPENLSEISTMQEMTSTICANSTQNTQYQLRDTRDNKTYYVAKLKDGNCWMTQNLAYETTNTYDIGEGKGNTGSYNVWRSNNSATGHGAYGNYYSGQVYSLEVCPTGWALPSRDQYATLASGLTTTTIKEAPYYFVDAGRVTYSSGTFSSLNALYWTSEEYEIDPNPITGVTGRRLSGYAFSMGDLSTNVENYNVSIRMSGSSPNYTSSVSYVNYAISVRCVAQ